MVLGGRYLGLIFMFLLIQQRWINLENFLRMGGSSLDNFIPIELRRKEQIRKLIESLVMENEKYKSSEIKVYEGSFQIVSKGLIP